jgi:hypothetical protein
MKNRSFSLLAALACATTVSPPLPAFAGGNTVYLYQENTGGEGSGNTIYIDQSGARNSQVGGISNVAVDGDNQITYSLSADPTLAPAKQIGSNNTADVTITGEGGLATVLQDNSGSVGFGNQATLNVLGSGFGAIQQNGDRNQANLTVNGSGAGAIRQNGNRNRGTLDVASGTDGTLVQNGNKQDITFSTVAGSGSQVLYTVNGNGVTQTAPVTVITNGASVTITQTSGF